MDEKNADINIHARTKREEARLKRIFRDLDKNKLQTVSKLIKSVAFMAVSLEDLEEKISDAGYTSKYKNGENQTGIKKSPEVELHLAMTKNYLAAIKQLIDITPPERKKASRMQALRDD